MYFFSLSLLDDVERVILPRPPAHHLRLFSALGGFLLFLGPVELVIFVLVFFETPSPFPILRFPLRAVRGLKFFLTPYLYLFSNRGLFLNFGYEFSPHDSRLWRFFSQPYKTGIALLSTPHRMGSPISKLTGGLANLSFLHLFCVFFVESI